MALQGNRSRLTLGAHRVEGIAPAQSLGVVHRGVGWRNWVRQTGATTVLATAAKPTGSYPPDCYHMPIVAGEMAVYVEGEGDADAAGGMAVEIDAALSGSGDITQADLALIVQAVAILTGSGDLTGDLDGLINAAASLSGSGTVVGAPTGLGNMSAAPGGTGTVTAVINATGNMAADITVTGTGLTTANVGPAVWATILEGVLSAEDVMQILLAVAAGKSVIVTGPPVHVQFRDQADTIDRVDATMSGSERTAVTLDVS